MKRNLYIPYDKTTSSHEYVDPVSKMRSSVTVFNDNSMIFKDCSSDITFEIMDGKITGFSYSKLVHNGTFRELLDVSLKDGSVKSHTMIA